MEKFKELFATVSKIKQNGELQKEYISEIKLMNPNEEYLALAMNTIEYLFVFLESYCGAHDFNIELNSDEYNIIEDNSYQSVV